MRNRRVSLFYLGYSLYFLSMFILDVNSYEVIIYTVLRYTSYIIFFLHIMITNRYNRKIIIRITLFLLFAVIVAVLTHDIYYLGVSLIILASLHEDIYKIINTSFKLLLSCSVIVALLTLLGIEENVSFIYNGKTRMGMGYYHSDVLPMIIFYLGSWRIIIKKKLNLFEIFLLLISTLSVYIACRSRNGLITVSVLIIYAYLNRRHTSKKLKQERNDSFITRLAYKYSILMLTVLSLVLTIFNGYHISSIYKINQIFSGRFALAYHKMNDVGLHFVNLMTGDAYTRNQVVVDNGYLYVILRYGFVFILLYIYIQYLIYKKYDNLICFIFAITSVACFVDNDLFSYGFLPYILLAFNQQQKFQYRTGKMQPKVESLKVSRGGLFN